MVYGKHVIHCGQEKSNDEVYIKRRTEQTVGTRGILSGKRYADTHDSVKGTSDRVNYVFYCSWVLVGGDEQERKVWDCGAYV